MNSKIDNLFATARGLEPAARDAYLAEACGDDAELRLEIQRMLVDAESADAFFGGEDSLQAEIKGHIAALHADGGREDTILDSTVETSAAKLKPEAEGEQIGRYKLLQEIGEGGFGTVWMAEQTEPVTRRVALKVIKLGMDTREVIARFEAERQALAMMDHPHIAKVLDAGATDRGRPYFVMELVKGIPITQYCDEVGLGTSERLALFGDVCAAIQHAHQKGIIHRDIKPSNVMITLYADKPVVKVIDFGIAKATQGKLTDKTLFTRFEQFVGTPVYMSPEQAAMSAIDIDTRSDIYSLGVLLYELLAGAPPFDQKSLLSAGYAEMRRIIAEDDPPKPSTRCTETQADPANQSKAKSQKSQLNPSALKGDLDWIVMKAIEKDRSRRYETANAFAADIGRYLSDEPVEAAAPSVGYKFKKFARRNKAAFGVAATMAMLLLAGIAATSWQAVRAIAEQKQAEEERDRANVAEQLAAVRLTESERAREDAEAISSFLTGMFESTRPGKEKGGRNVKVVDVLDRAVEKLETDLADQPERQAKLQETLGITYLALGIFPKAIPLIEQARDYRLTTLGPEHPNTLKAMSRVAGAYHVGGRRNEALNMNEELLVSFRKVFGPEHPDTLFTMRRLAGSYYGSSRYEEALEMGEEAFILLRKILGAEHLETLKAMRKMADYYQHAGRKDEALKMAEESFALFSRILGPEHPITLTALPKVAIAYSALGRHDEALQIREKVLEFSRKVFGPEHHITLTAMSALAGSYHAVDRRDEALKIQEKVLVLSRKVLGPEHHHTLSAMRDLAFSYHFAGRFEEALKLREEVLTLSSKVLGPENAYTLWTTSNLAASYTAVGRKDEALRMQEELLLLQRKVSGPEHPNTLKVMGELAHSYQDSGRTDEALKLHVEALAMARKINGLQDPFTFQLANKLAELYEKTGRKDEAAKLQTELKALKVKQ